MRNFAFRVCVCVCVCVCARMCERERERERESQHSVLCARVRALGVERLLIIFLSRDLCDESQVD